MCTSQIMLSHYWSRLIGGVFETPLDNILLMAHTPTQTVKWCYLFLSCFHGNWLEKNILSYVIISASEYIQFAAFPYLSVYVCVWWFLSYIYVTLIDSTIFDLHTCILEYLSVHTHTHTCRYLALDSEM